MAYIGRMKSKGQYRKVLKETGTIPKEWDNALVKTLHADDYEKMKKAARFKWPLIISLVINLGLLGYILFKFNIL